MSEAGREPALGRLLLAAQRSGGARDLERLVELAQAARGWPEHLERAGAAAAVARLRDCPPDLEALALAEHANAARASERYELAARLFEEAEALATARPATGARVLLLKAGLWRDLGRYEAAKTAAAEAARSFQQCDEGLEAGRAQSVVAQVQYLAGDIGGAMRSYERAMAILVDPDLVAALPEHELDAYERLVAAIQINSFALVAKAAEFEWDPVIRREKAGNALAMAARNRESIRDTVSELDWQQYEWMWARLLICLGSYQEARSTLEGVLAAYREAGLELMAGRAGLELLRCDALSGAGLRGVQERAVALAQLFQGDAWAYEQREIYTAVATARSVRKAARLVEGFLGRGTGGRRPGMSAAPVVLAD